MGVDTTENETGKFDEIVGVLVPGALNDTKKIRKAGGKIFAMVRPEKQEKSKTKLENPENRKK